MDHNECLHKKLMKSEVLPNTNYQEGGWNEDNNKLEIKSLEGLSSHNLKFRFH